MHFRASLEILLALSSLLSARAATIPLETRGANGAFRIESIALEAFAPAAALETTDNHAPLTRIAKKSQSSVFIEALRRGASGNRRSAVGNSPLIPAQGGAEYLTEIQYNDATVKVIVDTGSSDTWLIQQGFQCVDQFGSKQSTAACNFGTPYPGNFGSNKIPNVNFNITYGDGEFVTGDFGYADITLGGIKVPHQQSALGNYAYWNGDGISSGLLGLAYPDITSAWQGTVPSQDSTIVPYDPIFTTMYKNNLSTAMFSMAIERQTGGYIAFGGLPPVNYTGDFSTVPIQTMTVRRGSTPKYTFYAFTPDAIVYKGAPTTQSSVYIVDSGTTLVYAPADVASAIAKLFSPPAKAQSGVYVVDCKATAPNFGIKIAGTTFVVNPADMIVQNGNTCISGILDGGSGPYILGDVFMTNVVVVFDVGAAQMKFAAHVNY